MRSGCRRGQKFVKRQMQRYVKKWKTALGVRITCKTCHSNFAPRFDLKPEGLKLYRKYMKGLKTSKQGAHLKEQPARGLVLALR